MFRLTGSVRASGFLKQTHDHVEPTIRNSHSDANFGSMSSDSALRIRISATSSVIDRPGQHSSSHALYHFPALRLTVTVLILPSIGRYSLTLTAPMPCNLNLPLSSSLHPSP